MKGENNMSVIICKECGQEIEANSKQCPNCGFVIEEVKETIQEVEQSDLICKKCGTLLNENQRFCPKCGTEKGFTNNKKCQNCGEILETGEKFCSKCGAKAKLDFQSDLMDKTKKIQINKIVEFIKVNTKKIILGIIAIIAIIVAIDLIFVSPKEIVNKFVNSINSANSEKAFKCISIAGMYVFINLDEDEYEDFWEEYKDFKDSDEYEDIIDEFNDEREDLFDELDDYDISIEINKIKRVKKISSHLYRISVKADLSFEDEEDSGTIYFYVMKEGTKSYIVGMKY